MPRKSIDYSKCVIYKIVCNDLNIKDLYVGNTTDLIKRRSMHKYSCCNPTCKFYDLKIYKTIRDNGGWDNWSVIVIEKLENCKDSEEARTRERFWYEQLFATMNSNNPLVHEEEHKQNMRDIAKEHYNNNKEDKLSKSKQYYQDNKEKIILQQKKYKEKNKETLTDYRKQYCKQYRLENKDKIQQYREATKDKMKQYYQENKEKILLQQKEYKQEKFLYQIIV